MGEEAQADEGNPCIESVSDDGEVAVRLANGRKSVIHVPIEQVDQLRRAAFFEAQRARPRWEYAFEG